MNDDRRRRLARTVRQATVESFHQQMVDAGVEHAYVLSENGELRLSHPELMAPIAAFFELSQDFDEHEAVFLGRDPRFPTIFLAAVHDTRRGLAQGGLRFKSYRNLAGLLTDGLRLAQGMTRKNALAGLWWGGGKGIVAASEGIIDDPRYADLSSLERRELFRAYGRFVASLGGVYYTAEDVGTKTEDMNAILGVNRFTTCIADALGGSGNPSPHTARGVFRALQAAWRYLTGSDDLRGVPVAVQGAGNVGGPLIDLLHAARATLYVCDPTEDARVAVRARCPGVEIVDLEAIYDTPAEIFAPCAVGGVVNRDTIPRLARHARLICGAANNVLKEPADAERLRRRGIAYVPDYLCNRMGITNCADEWQGYLEDDVRLAAERVYPDTLRVLKHARAQMITTAEAADQLSDIAASELHPLIGHRGRRLLDHLVASGWHRPTAPDGPASRSATRSRYLPPFDPGVDEPRLRMRWEHDLDRAIAAPAGAIAAAPVAASGRPDLSTLCSALLADVAARADQLADGRPRRRVLGADPGGLTLQLAVERALPFEREEIGRGRFVEVCHDAYATFDAAVRQQLHELGVELDARRWIDVAGSRGRTATRRLLAALGDRGLVRRERRLTWFDPASATVLVSPDVTRTEVEVAERWTLRYPVAAAADGEGGADGEGIAEEIAVHSFFPELLLGAVGVAVRADGPHAHLADRHVDDPLRPGERLPIVAVDELEADATAIVPAHDRSDAELARAHGLGDGSERGVLDRRGLVRLPGRPPLEREQARQELATRLGGRLSHEEGVWRVETWRARGSGTLVNLGPSRQVFVDLSLGAERLRRAIEDGAVTFSHERWRRQVLTALDELEPWCISRGHWWGHPLELDDPGARSDASDDEQTTASVWLTLAAWTLHALGWPEAAEPAPLDEVFVDAELIERWLVPSQILALTLCHRPAFRHVHVHGTVHLARRELVERPGSTPDQPDEERFVSRPVKRPMRRRLGNSIEPATLIRRFGADALRLGYLLSLPVGGGASATLDESRLRRGRSTVQRLVSKVGGLLHLVPEPLDTPATDDPNPQLADLWILAHLDALADAARADLAARRVRPAAEAFARAADALARYARVAASRPRRPAHQASIRPTVARLVALLHDPFAALCPFALESLRETVAPHTAADPAAWAPGGMHHLPLLVEVLRRRPPGARTAVVATPDAPLAALLTPGAHELGLLAGIDFRVEPEPPTGDVRLAGPAVVVYPPGPAGPTLPTGDEPAAIWYRSLHSL